MRTLSQVRPGQEVRILRLHGHGAVKRRLMEMGLTRDAGVFVRKVAPLGDPIQVSLRGYELTLRRQDAESVEVT